MEDSWMRRSKSKKEKGINNNKKAGLITKTWERCKSWPRRYGGNKTSVAPDGCFSVYVGAEMQRFVIKTEYANHPLFKMLLEEAESEYGYNSHGPLALPCNVEVFYKVLVEMEDSQETRQPCAFLNRSQSAYQLLSPSPMLTINHF